MNQDSFWKTKEGDTFSALMTLLAHAKITVDATIAPTPPQPGEAGEAVLKPGDTAGSVSVSLRLDPHPGVNMRDLGDWATSYGIDLERVGAFAVTTLLVWSMSRTQDEAEFYGEGIAAMVARLNRVSPSNTIVESEEVVREGNKISFN